MNKLVVTMAAGLYAVTPAPGVEELTGRVTYQIGTLITADPVPYHPLEVSVNGATVSLASPRVVEPPQSSSGCQRARYWSFKQLVAGAFSDECATQEASHQKGAVPVGASSRS